MKLNYKTSDLTNPRYKGLFNLRLFQKYLHLLEERAELERRLHKLFSKPLTLPLQYPYDTRYHHQEINKRFGIKRCEACRHLLPVPSKEKSHIIKKKLKWLKPHQYSIFNILSLCPSCHEAEKTLSRAKISQIKKTRKKIYRKIERELRQELKNNEKIEKLIREAEKKISLELKKLLRKIERVVG